MTKDIQMDMKQDYLMRTIKALALAFIVITLFSACSSDIDAPVRTTTAVDPSINAVVTTTTEVRPIQKRTRSGILVYVTKDGEKYHTEECRYIDGKDVIPIDKADAESAGYEPCSVCDP